MLLEETVKEYIVKRSFGNNGVTLLGDRLINRLVEILILYSKDVFPVYLKGIKLLKLVKV